MEQIITPYISASVKLFFAAMNIDNMMNIMAYNLIQNTFHLLRQMRKLPWDDAELSTYACTRLTAVWNVKYFAIRCLANLLAGLVAHHDWLGPAVVDALLEDIRLGLEASRGRRCRTGTCNSIGVSMFILTSFSMFILAGESS